MDDPSDMVHSGDLHKVDIHSTGDEVGVPVAEDDTAKGNEKTEKAPTVGFFSLYRYATKKEKFYMLFSCLCATIHGCALPSFTILFGNIITQFTQPAATLDGLGDIARWFFVIGAGACVLATCQIRFTLYVASQIGGRMRKLYFRSLMKQDDAWYDAQSMKHKSAQAGAYISRLSDVNLVQAGIGDKVAILIQYVSMFICGFIVAFIFSWKLTLAVLATVPLLAIAGGVMAKVTTDSTSGGLGAYSRAGSIANEAIGMMKTVTAFGAQKEEEERYAKELEQAYKSEVKKSFAMGVGLGSVMLVFMCIFGFSLWFGNWLIVRGHMDKPGDVFIVFFAVVIGASGLGQSGPHVNSISIARGAAPAIFEVIERDSEIDPLDLDSGKKPSDISGSIKFENVDFRYPTKQEADTENAYVLENFSLEIPEGSSQSLVGESGSGKSTVARLIEQFYSVEGGRVLIGGHDIKDLNVAWLRNQIGYVGQMPTLFAISIKENIALGMKAEIIQDRSTGKSVVHREEPTMDQIVEAAKLANAHKFIQELPEGYDTVLGARGALLSGGQKQRVCIARALVRKPKILILDEATASLDSKSETIVQEAIDNIMKTSSITTVIIAHRLSTVKDSDKIAVMRKGKIEELGSHDELMDKNGAYKRLIQAQEITGQDQVAESKTIDEEKMKSFSEETKTEDGSEDSEKRKAAEEREKQLQKGAISRAFRMNKAEALYILFGIVGAVMAGSAWPVSAIVMSKMTNILGVPGNASDVRFYALMYFAIGCAAFVGNVLQLGFLGISGNKLTTKIRKRAFNMILRQDMGFFDMPGNDVGALTSKLSSEATLVRGLTGDTLGTLAVAISTLACGLLIAFIWCWRIALTVLAIVPGVAVGGAMEMKMMTGFDAQSEKNYSLSAGTAAEAIDGIVTVRALGAQDHFLDKYDALVDVPSNASGKKSWIKGASFGFSQLAQFCMWGVAFWVGSIFVKQDHCTFEEMFIGITGLTFGAMTLGNVSAFAPDFGASKRAAGKLFQLIDSGSKIDPEGSGEVLNGVKGDVKCTNIEFQYPTRPDIPVLRGLSMAVQPGKTLAIVGESGSGKSTVVQLIQRFYDVSSGSIQLEETDIQSLDVQHYRSTLGVVQQEPDLFNRSIRDNITYGLANFDGAPITDELIENAAKEANAHNFIQSLPGKYDYIVGERGALLSGGQKQRVAIARSLIRQPKILLLDEATSALDAESERIAQDALEKASATRTTIVVAHRLSTFKSADQIAVVRYGEIIEIGTHDELLRKGGYYRELVRNQLS